MIYAHFVLSKKGPLARIWLAAHWDKKLTKAHVFETDIDSSIEAILQPKVKLALRTSGHLLLGVVRIYSRKAKYLLADCNEAFVKIKMAFRPGMVDLPEDNREAAIAAITLPENFHDFDTAMADLNDFELHGQFSVNQSRPEEITMREDLGMIALVTDDGFGDMGFDSVLQDVPIDDGIYMKHRDAVFGPGKSSGIDSYMNDFDDGGGADDDSDNDGGDFGGGMDTELFGSFAAEGGGLFEEPPPVPESSSVDKKDVFSEKTLQTDTDLFSLDTILDSRSSVTAKPSAIGSNQSASDAQPVHDLAAQQALDAETFTLEPVDVTTVGVHGTERRTRRKRKLIIDDQKGIPSEAMKVQLSDTSDIVSTMDLAPPTKKLMVWKETGGVDKLFSLPGRTLVSRRIGALYSRCLVSRPVLDDEEKEEKNRLHLDQVSSDNEDAEDEDRETARESIGGDSDVPPLLEPASSRASTSVRHPRKAPARRGRESPVKPVSPPDFHDFGGDDDDYDNDAMLLPSIDQTDLPELDLSEDGDIFENSLPEPDMPEGKQSKVTTAAELEEQEEVRWGKRTQQMAHLISRAMTADHSKSVTLQQLLHHNNRKQAASKFYTMLVLKKAHAVEVRQPEMFGEITISQGSRFDQVMV